MKIGETIATLRKANGLRLKDLAKLAGISINSLSSYENGLFCPNMTTLKKICEAMNVSVPYFFLTMIEESDFPEADKEKYKYYFLPLKEIMSKQNAEYSGQKG